MHRFIVEPDPVAHALGWARLPVVYEKKGQLIYPEGVDDARIVVLDIEEGTSHYDLTPLGPKSRREYSRSYFRERVEEARRRFPHARVAVYSTFTAPAGFRAKSPEYKAEFADECAATLTRIEANLQCFSGYDRWGTEQPHEPNVAAEVDAVRGSIELCQMIRFRNGMDWMAMFWHRCRMKPAEVGRALDVPTEVLPVLRETAAAEPAAVALWSSDHYHMSRCTGDSAGVERRDANRLGVRGVFQEAGLDPTWGLQDLAFLREHGRSARRAFCWAWDFVAAGAKARA